MPNSFNNLIGNPFSIPVGSIRRMQDGTLVVPESEDSVAFEMGPSAGTIQAASRISQALTFPETEDEPNFALPADDLTNAGWTRADGSAWTSNNVAHQFDMMSPPSPPPIINDRRGDDAPIFVGEMTARPIRPERIYPFNLERPEPPGTSRRDDGQYYYEQGLIDLHIAFEPAGYEPSNMFCPCCGQWRGYIHTCENELCNEGNLPLAGVRHDSAVRWETQNEEARQRRQNPTPIDFRGIEERALATQRQLSQFASSDSNRIVDEAPSGWRSTMSVGRSIGGGAGVSGSVGIFGGSVTEW